MCSIKVDPYPRNVARVQGRFELSPDVEIFQGWPQPLQCCKGQGLQLKVGPHLCNAARVQGYFEL